ncbi:MAG: chromosome segregation protein SMC [Chloroflexi bacterium]|nr:MAG: chromosome segregation protein SMC [Chloroflexota bacterium]
MQVNKISYVSRVGLRNWKNFQEVDIPLTWRAFIIGPNASGKSNFLDVFRFLKDVALNGLNRAVEVRGGVSAIRCLSARRYPDITVEVELQGNEGVVWCYALSLNQDNQRRPIIKRESVQKNGQSLLVRPSAEDKEDPERLTQTALEQISENRPFRSVADFFKSVSYRHLIPQIVRNPADFTTRPVKNDPYGRDFLRRMWETNKRTRDSRLNKISQAIKIAVPQLSKLSLEMDEKTGIVHLIGRYEHWRPSGAKQDESQFSDGTLRLLGLLWTVFEGSGPLLLEEPEISLHPELVRRLPSVFYRLTRERKQPRQIIISTHSEEMLRDEGIAPTEVLLLQPSPNGTEISLPDEADIRAMREGRLTAADVLMPKVAPQNIHQLELPW